jgi:hypothetical protein
MTITEYSDFTGKTVKRIYCQWKGHMVIEFTDGCELEVIASVEDYGHDLGWEMTAKFKVEG